MSKRRDQPDPRDLAACVDAIRALRADGLTYAAIARLCNLAGNHYEGMQRLEAGLTTYIRHRTVSRIQDGYRRYLAGDRNYKSRQSVSSRPGNDPVQRIRERQRARAVPVARPKSASKPKRTNQTPAQQSRPPTLLNPQSRLAQRLKERRGARS